MCGRYRRTMTYREYVEVFADMGMPLVFPNPGLEVSLEAQDLVRPMDRAPILRIRSNGEGLELLQARWSLPSRRLKRTSRPPAKRIIFNVKAETIANSAKLKEAFAKRRCLVPAEAWFEMTGKPRRRTMWEFMPKGGGALFFAGLWERLDDPNTGPTDAFVVITEPAGSPLNAYRDRAPVVLWGFDRQIWLDPKTELRELRALLGPESPDGFDVRRVSGPSLEIPDIKMTGRPAEAHSVVPGNNWVRKVRLLQLRATALETLGRVQEAACYRRDAEKMVARTAITAVRHRMEKK